MADLEKSLAALAERARRARMRRSEREYPPLAEVQPILEALVAAYREAADVERERMRSCWRGTFDAQTWLLWVAGEWARGSAGQRTLDDFENALAALSLEDQSLDVEDTRLVLGVVWHRAHRAGIDVRPAIEHAAAMSSNGDGGFAALLRELEHSTFLREIVTPHLGSEALPYEAEE